MLSESLKRVRAQLALLQADTPSAKQAMEDLLLICSAAQQLVPRKQWGADGTRKTKTYDVVVPRVTLSVQSFVRVAQAEDFFKRMEAKAGGLV